MENLQAVPMFQWQMYGPGSAVEFSASRNEAGYGLVVTRNQELLVSCAVSDVPAMFLKSSHLREHLQRLGFAATPAGEFESQLGGGVSWGPASPLDSSVVAAFI